MTKIYMRALLVLAFVMISLSAVHGGTNNSSYIYSDNLSSDNSDNKTSDNSDNKTSDNSDNKTSYNDASNNSHNQATIDKHEGNKTINKHEGNKTISRDKKGSTSNTTKSRVVIRKYVKPKDTPGFDGTTMVFVMIMTMICVSTKKDK